MTNDPDLVQLAKDQQAEIMSELNGLAQNIGALKGIASSASTDAREFAGLISPEARSLINWCKATMLIGAAFISLVGTAAVLWLNANFVSTRVNDEAWGKQVNINLNNYSQFKALEIVTRVNDVADAEQNRRLDEMDTDLRELRQVLGK